MRCEVKLNAQRKDGLRRSWRVALIVGALGTSVLSAQCRFSAVGSRQVTYRFVPEMAAGGLTLHVSLEFVEGPTGVEKISVPTQWAGEMLKSVSALRVASEGATLEGEPGAGEWVVRAAPGVPVKVTYDLIKDWTKPFKHPLQFHPIVTPQYIEFTGNNALVRLELSDQDTETANFDWSSLPPSWSLATSFGSTSSAVGRCQTHTGPWQSIHSGLYAAGDFRLVPFQILGKPATLAVRGDWVITDEQAVKQIQTVVSVVRNFWHDNRFPYFLVTLAPYDQEHGSSDGSQFTNAFWMFVSSKDSINGLLPQLAHESFHAWDPKKMGTIPSGYDERYIRWFDEGTTEYYAQLLTLRAGLLSQENYVASLNSVLRRFPDSSDEYIRGRIISLWLDRTIRKDSHQRHSLDTVMFDMVRGANQTYTYERLLATIDRYLSPQSRILLRKAVMAQGNLPAPEYIPQFEGCAKAVMEPLPVFDLGFDMETARTSKAISGVRQDGPAYAAGLRDGQKLMELSFIKGNPDRLVTLKVNSGTDEQRISFYPRGKIENIWQYELQPREQCVAKGSRGQEKKPVGARAMLLPPRNGGNMSR